MNTSYPYVDIHCHLVPEIDDGSKSWDETLAMAKMAVADGTRTIIVTPHQLGNFSHNTGEVIRIARLNSSRFSTNKKYHSKCWPAVMFASKTT